MTSPDNINPAGAVGALGAFSEKTQEDWESEQQSGILSHFPIFSVNYWISLALGLLADLLDMVPIVGGTLSDIVENIADGINTTNTTAHNAQTTAVQASATVVNIQTQIFSIRSGRPLWDGIDGTAESTFPYALLALSHGHTAQAVANHDHNITGNTATASSHNHGAGSLSNSNSGGHTPVINNHWAVLTVDCGAAQNVGGFVRLRGGDEKRAFSFIANISAGAPTWCGVGVYRMLANGDIQFIWQSDNLIGSLSGTLQVVQATVPDGTPGFVGEEGETILLEIRTGGPAGSTINVAGVDITGHEPLAGYRPKKLGSLNTITPPGDIADASVGYTTRVPYIEAGQDLGSNTVPIYLIDGFDRANGVLTSPWVVRRSGSTSSYLTITSNAVSYNGSTDGTQAALHGTALHSDHPRVQFQTRTLNGAQPCRLIVCSNSAMTNYAAAEIWDDEVKISTGSGVGSLTQRAQLTTGSVGGDGFGLEYDDTTNNFHLYKNSNPTPILSWWDGSNIVTHGAGKRFAGISITRAVFNDGGDIDSWLAFDVTE